MPRNGRVTGAAGGHYGTASGKPESVAV